MLTESYPFKWMYYHIKSNSIYPTEPSMISNSVNVYYILNKIPIHHSLPDENE